MSCVGGRVRGWRGAGGSGGEASVLIYTTPCLTVQLTVQARQSSRALPVLNPARRGIQNPSLVLDMPPAVESSGVNRAPALVGLPPPAESGAGPTSRVAPACSPKSNGNAGVKRGPTGRHPVEHCAGWEIGLLRIADFRHICPRGPETTRTTGQIYITSYAMPPAI